jgi:tumor protein p53-inducible protein 3
LKAGQTVLIHAGGSGVGTSLVQLAKAIGATAIVTAGTDEKIAQCVELGASFGVNYKTNPAFSEVIKEKTNGNGVDLILDCVGASYFAENMASIKIEGTWVVYGLMGGFSVENFDMRGILGKRITLTGTTLRTRSVDYKIGLINSFKEFGALERFDDQTFRPIIDRMFPIEEIAEAHRYMESNANIGKIVIQVKH